MNTAVLYLALAGCALVYVQAAARPSPQGRRWPRARTGWFLAALVVFALIYGPGLGTYEDNASVNVLQHMLVMMAIPALFVLSAPITLLLRALPIRTRRLVVRELHDPALRPLSGRWAPVLLAADYYLTMYAYELTPMRTLADQHALVHIGVHQYFLLCGLLFWLPIVGVDPVRLRPSRRVKQLMILAGLPAFAVLGAIRLIQGDPATGWTYLITGTALTVFASIGLAVGSATCTRNSATRHHASRTATTTTSLAHDTYGEQTRSVS